MEFIVDHWWIVERAASVAAVIFFAICLVLVRELRRERADAKEERAKREALMERFIDAGLKNVAVIEQNTAAQEALGELIRDRRKR